MVMKTKIKLTEDRPLKGARSFRSRSAGPKGPFLLLRSFRSSSFMGKGNLNIPPSSTILFIALLRGTQKCCLTLQMARRAGAKPSAVRAATSVKNWL